MSDRDCKFCGDSFSTAEQKNAHEPSCRPWEKAVMPRITLLRAFGPARQKPGNPS